MKFTVRHDMDKYVAQLEIDATDVLEAALDPTDRALLRECEHSSSISDKLLALETIARRVEEAYLRKTGGH